MFKRQDVIYLNFLSPGIVIVLLVLGLSKRARVMDHSGCQVGKWSGFELFIYSAFLRRCDEVIFVGAHLHDYYRKKGVRLPDKTRVQNAFIAPPLDEEMEILNTYPGDIRKFVKQRRPLLVANAFKIVLHNRVDLYGLDMCVDLVAKLKNTYPDVGLLFALADIENREYFKCINQRINKLGISENFKFMTDQKELWPLFKEADLLVRPTYVDAYGISIAEALYFGCRAVASDVCERPEGTVLFKNRDLEDLYSKCRSLLRNPK